MPTPKGYIHKDIYTRHSPEVKKKVEMLIELGLSNSAIEDVTGVSNDRVSQIRSDIKLSKKPLDLQKAKSLILNRNIKDRDPNSK